MELDGIGWTKPGVEEASGFLFVGVLIVLSFHVF
jgi:hypothetical protein